ncbi:polysaccharide deacetylase family protein [Pseudoduganella danionis]|uniref:Polysaccharide deacetylase family protein n=1 Tax=Pseudoduganella danionis TaxID=1890295 RepID=A0ABW9SRW9_9BURK|nr:polysaccharide deacetylase family protein [Pseudoduganella danionis]MTW34901.1 polysaccharide deacetylase family protein [Pseudoduganella danionis]
MRKLLLSVLCSLLAGGAQAQATPASTAWPHGARVAVSLGYDDTLASQLDVALPALQRHGLKASFYLQLSSPLLQSRLAEWRRVAQLGHELGNHSLFHQCAGSLPGHAWVEPARDLDSTTAAQMADQVLLGNAMLFAIDGERERTYTVPCGDHQARDGDYLPRIAAAFVGIKQGGGSGVTARAVLQRHAVAVYAPVGLSGSELIALVRAAGAQGDMVNLTFHGVGGDYLGTSAAAHEELLAYLASHRDEYWTDTFRNIMRYVRAQESADGHH